MAIECPDCNAKMERILRKTRKYKTGKINTMREGKRNYTIGRIRHPLPLLIRKWYCRQCGYAIIEKGNFWARLDRRAKKPKNRKLISWRIRNMENKMKWMNKNMKKR